MEIIRRDGLDQISRLPNDILVRILSLLPTEEAVRSSFLSKRWKSLWTSLPVLDLDFNSFSKKFNMLCLDDRKERFLEFVEYVFFLHEVRQLQKLRFAFDIVGFKVYNSRIRMLVRFAMKSDCSTLDLDFSRGNEGLFLHSRDLYTLPPCSFPHQSLTDLKLSKCKFRPSIYKNFVSLKTAILTRVELPKDSVYHLISNSPCLEELHLIQCRLSSHLHFHFPKSKLKCFVLDWCYDREDDVRWVDINIPNLLRFKFAGMLSDHFSINSGENLIEAELDLHVYEFQQMLLCDILKDLHRVKILTLCSWCLEVLSANGGTILPTTFCNLRHLTVKPCSEHSELLSLACLLRSAPYLETLSIHFNQVPELGDDVISSLFDDDVTFWKPHLLPSNYVSHLKKVEIKGFYGGANEMELVKIMLKNSLCLEKMVICKEGMRSRYAIVMQHGNENHLKFLQRQQEKTIENLFAFTRASLAAQVLLA